jgi:hypothetical protein
MRTHTICLAFILILLCPYASSQWVQTNGPYGGDVTCFAASGANLFAGTFQGGVFLSTNSGTSWAAVNTGMTNTNVWTFAVSGGNLFAGTSGGVFLSTNSGTSWTQTGLMSNIVNALAVSGGNLFAGTWGTGVWRRLLSEMITSVDPSMRDLPHEFSLSQNYPNPFNPSTTIRYGLPHKSQVSLIVYNTLGQLVSQLVSGEQEAGYHEVRFAGSGLASGVYFYRQQAGDFTRRASS